MIRINHRVVFQGVAEGRARAPLPRGEVLLVDQRLGEDLLPGALLPGQRITQPLAFRLHDHSCGDQGFHLLEERILGARIELRLLPPVLQRE